MTTDARTAQRTISCRSNIIRSTLKQILEKKQQKKTGKVLGNFLDANEHPADKQSACHFLVSPRSLDKSSEFSVTNGHMRASIGLLSELSMAVEQNNLVSKERLWNKRNVSLLTLCQKLYTGLPIIFQSFKFFSWFVCVFIVIGASEEACKTNFGDWK